MSTTLVSFFVSGLAAKNPRTKNVLVDYVKALKTVQVAIKTEEKAKDGKKVVKRKPPERNFAMWDEATFKRLVTAPPERLSSRFSISHGRIQVPQPPASSTSYSRWTSTPTCRAHSCRR